MIKLKTSEPKMNMKRKASRRAKILCLQRAGGAGMMGRMLVIKRREILCQNEWIDGTREIFGVYVGKVELAEVPEQLTPKFQNCNYLVMRLGTLQFLLLHILNLSFYLQTFAVAAVTPANCTATNTRTRSEWRNLNGTQRASFINAIKTLRTKPSRLHLESRYHDYIKVHADNADAIHMSPLFWPWHRAFLYEFETELRTIDPTVSIPLWDWATDAQHPLRNTDLLGPAGAGSRNPRRGGHRVACLADGFAAGWRGVGGNCLSRVYEDGVNWEGYDTLAPVVLKSPSFRAFRGIAENCHNDVHVGIGGDLTEQRPPGPIGTMTDITLSPNDPLFWMHHAFVDYLWWRWQQAHPLKANDYDGKDLHSKMKGLQSGTVQRALSLQSWCIVYEPYSKAGGKLKAASAVTHFAMRPGSPVGSGKKKNTVARKKKTPLSKIWVEKNIAHHKKVPVEEVLAVVRKHEAVVEDIKNEFDKAMDDFLDANPSSSYSDAYDHTISNFEWKESWENS
ncbi:hypothetical protein BC830DRAFT_1083412 [Chytriomyces sp. MP71]|nr:hypothetical protein BC830DRAFT_1083412 [Chytriomyces sp. MP71]